MTLWWICVCRCVCVWTARLLYSLFRIAQSAGYHNLPFRDRKRKVACRSGKVKLSRGLRGDRSLTGGIPAFPVLRVEVLSCLAERDAPPSSPPFLITVLQCKPIHKPKYMNIPVYSIICFLSMWSYGEDVDLTLYLGHRSLCVVALCFCS